MKKFVLLFLSLWAIQLSMAQYVTPGNGTTYTLNNLVTVSNGAVQLVGSEYHITADLTITSPDILSIQEDAVIIGTNGKRVYVQGQAQINPPNEVLLVSSDTTDISNPFINLYLTENASNSVIRNLNMRFCCGLKIVEAQNVLVENCTFYKNQYKSTHGSGAITLSDCAPIIRNCTFIENVRSAISSPSNGSVTPTIEGCYMYHNVTGNNNMPQINLGPGSATDTVFIRNNYIEGHVTMSGGISLATMTGGTIIAVVENNEIVGNRYGINQFGNSITLFARNNEIVNNNLETNPNNGGSGITVYCTTENTTKLYATGNYISGNLWGITLVANASANLGNLNGTGIEYNIGHNIIVNNTNGGVEYNLYNNTVHPQMAQGNYWGFATAEESEAVIWHQPDISSLGLVTYAPIWVPISCLGGIKNIPGDYATLEEAVTALNGAEICEGGVTFVLQNGVTYNTAPLTITATGSESSPIIFTANDLNGEKPIINATATADAQAAINLVGSDYVTFNHLSILAANEMLDYGIALTAENGTNGCQYNTVSNCAITMTKNTNNTNGIYTFCNTPTAVSGSNSFNQFYNNNISNCYIAINMMNDQSNSLYFDEANQVYATELGLSQYTNLMMCGVYAKGQKGFKVYNNVVSGVNETTETTNPAGMSFIDENPTETLLQYNYEVYNNIIENIHSNTKTVYGIYFSARKTAAQIYGNIIRNVKTFANDNSTANGITIIASSTNVDFYNNMISDIAAAGCAVSNAPATRGIVISTSGSVNVYYNSVVLDYIATNTAHQCAPIFIHGNTTPYLLQNNIFANYAELPAGATGRVVAYFKRNNTLNTSYINPLCNNNLYYAGVPSENHLVFYGHNSSSPLIDQTIATFKTRMAAVSPNLEQNSISVNPPFVNSLTDLHIIATEPTPIDGGGITVSGITTDIDGNIRDANTPDIGAHEFSVGSSCLPPTNLVQSVDYVNQLLICEWDTPGNALAYNIWFNGMDVTGYAYNFGWMTDTSIVVPMSYLAYFPPAEEYCIKLRSICAIGDSSEWSETSCASFEDPNVTITLENITQTAVEAGFEKVGPCTSYYILNGTASEMEMWMQMMQMTLEQLVQMWGLQIYNDTTYVWDELSPNTQYTIYALPLGADGTQYPLQTQVYTTLSSGGSGEALVTIDLTEITQTSVRMIVTPNENTAVFFDGLITVELFNELGEEAAIDIIKTNGYPLYATDDWVWQGLLPNTAYKAIGIGMNADSVWGIATISEFSTLGDSPCGITALPYFEGFEGTFPTECWTMVYGDGVGTTNPMSYVSDPVYEGTQSFAFSSFSETTDYNQYLITPEINVSGSMKVSFYYHKYTYGIVENFKVGYSLTGNAIDNFVWGDPVSATNNDAWDYFEMMVPEGTKYVAINYCSFYEYYLYIDAFSIDVPAACTRPTNLTASTTSNSATLSWLENGTATSWNIEYGEAGFEQGSGTIITVSENPYSLTNLAPNSNYAFCVQAVCSADEVSDWNCSGSFSTLCESFTAPFTENFAAEDFPYGCWSKLTGLASNAFAGINPVPTTAVTSNTWKRVTYSCGLTAEHAKINVYGLECNSWMVTPAITLESNSVLQFDAAFTKYAISESDPNCGTAPTGDITDDKFMVIISTDGGNTWNESDATVWMGDQLLQIPESGTRLTIDLASYSGDVRIAFYCESTQTGGDNDFHIDNIFVGASSTNCNPPTNLTAVADYMDIRLDWESPITRTDLFFEDFENIEGEALPEGWTALDTDGDGYNWYGINDPQMIGHSGTGLVSSASWVGPVLTPDNWLITPQIAISSGCTLNYWVSAQDASYAADHYGVYISTTGTSPNDFTLLFEETMTAKEVDNPGTRGVNAQGQWYERTIDLSNFSGPVHIAFRHFNCTDQFRINVDDVRLFDASTNVFNVYKNNTLIAEQISTLFYIDPVTEVGEHCYTVTTVCGITESDPSNMACANAFAPECIAPSNLLALDNNNNVDLTWEASPTAVSYKVFTNGYMLASELTETTFTDASLGAGTYCYTVKAVCAYGESENSNEACATIDEGVCNPPANVAAVATDDQITVTWDEPFTGKAWMTWSGNPATAVGTGSAADFSVAHRYETIDLTAYDGLQLTKIRLVPNVDICDYSLRVWVGGDGTAPEEMIVDQPITQNLSYGVWNEVVLNTPVTIDADRELWIGYRCNTQTGTPAGCDEGPQVAGKGNMIFLNNIWDQMNNLAPTLTFNWCIKSLVVTANGESMALPALVDESNTSNTSSLVAVKTETNSKATLDDNLKYDLYRNGTLLAEGITERTYMDENLTMGHYCYTVVALCDNGDSDPSEEACADITSINEEETAYRIFPNPANNSLNIEGENIETISVYNVLGQMIDHVQEIHQTTVKLNTATYENGTYILRIVNGEGSISSQRIVIAH